MGAAKLELGGTDRKNAVNNLKREHFTIYCCA